MAKQQLFVGMKIKLIIEINEKKKKKFINTMVIIVFECNSKNRLVQAEILRYSKRNKVVYK